MKIGELAKRTEISAHTVRYYERIGLLPYADRDGGGQRDYDQSILTWIDFLGRMKTTGMPIREMLRYANLRQQGDHTGPKRRAMLEAHREKARARVADLEACLLILDIKIDGYVEAEKRTQNHDDATTRLTGNQTGARTARA